MSTARPISTMRSWFNGFGRGCCLLLTLVVLSIAMGCDQSQSVSDAQFIAEAGADGEAKPDDSPVPPGPPATAEELARLPVVDAGPRQISDTNVVLDLVGRGEVRGDDSTPVRVSWQQIEGPPVTITDPDSLECSITVPDLTEQTRLRFRLAVWDGDNRANADTTTILVRPQPLFARVVSATVTEGSEQAVFTIRLSEPAPAPLTLSYRTLDGTAREYVDYEPVEGQAAFDTGTTDAQVTVNLLPNPAGGGRYFRLEIVTPVNETDVFITGVMNIEAPQDPTREQTLSFASESVVLQVGEKILVEPDTSGAPGSGALRWVSSDPQVALVDGVTGEVTGVAPGTATIIVEKEADRDYLGASAEYTVRVGSDALVPQELVFELDGPQRIFIDETLVNEAIECVVGDGKLTYSSDRPDIATVDDNGLVTPHAPGVAVITAHIEASEGYAETSISYELTVVLRPMDLSTDSDGVQLQPGDSERVVISEQSPHEHDDCGEQSHCDLLTVTSSDPSVAVAKISHKAGSKRLCDSITVSITAVAPGTATITVTLAAHGIYGPAQIEIPVEVLPPATES